MGPLLGLSPNLALIAEGSSSLVQLGLRPTRMELRESLMELKLQNLSQRAREVARIAADLARSGDDDHSELHRAMVEYRSAAIGYMAHPSVGDYVRADARRYDGETREAVERIADLIDGLCDPEESAFALVGNETA